MGDIDIYLIKDKSTNEFLKDKDGHISKWYSRNEAEKAAKELSKDKIFEEIVLLNK